MSVINKMLRDLDSRQSNNAALGVVGAARPGHEARVAGAAQGVATLTRPAAAPKWRVGVAVTLLLLATAAAGWWALRLLGPSGADPAAALRVGSAPAAGPSAPSSDVRTAPVLPPAAPVNAATPASAAPQPALPVQPPTVGTASTAPSVATAPRPQATASAAVPAGQGLNLKPASGLVRSPAADLAASKPAHVPAVLAQVTPLSAVSEPAAALVWPTAPSVPSAPAKPAPQAAFDLVAQARTLSNDGDRGAALLLLKGALQRLEAAPASAAVSDTASVAALAREYAHQTLAGGQPAEALATLERLEPRLAGVADLWALRGNAAQRLGLHTQAVSAYQQALALSPNEPRWLLGAAVSLAALGQTGAAAELAEKVRAARALPADVANYLRQLGVPIRAD